MEQRLKQIRDSALNGKMSGFAGCVFGDDYELYPSGQPNARPLLVPQWYWAVGVWLNSSNEMESVGYLVPNYAWVWKNNEWIIDDNPTTEFTEEYNQVPISDIVSWTGVEFSENVLKADILVQRLRPPLRPPQP